MNPAILQATLAQAFTWRPVVPELLLLVAILILPIMGLYMKGRSGTRDLGRATVIVLVGALALVMWMMATGAYLDEEIFIADYLALYEVTMFSQFLKVIFLFVAVVIALASIEYASAFRNPIEYYALLMLATAGMMVVASSRDLITLFIGIETASLSTYVMAGYAKNDKYSTEAGTKYFIIGALSSAIFLYGISLVYGITGSLRFEEIAAGFDTAFGMSTISLVAIVLILVGIGFKVSLAPFHMWAPDVYHGAPDTVAGFLSAGSKAMGFAAAFKVFLVGFIALKAQWDLLLGLLAVVTMTLGNIVALRQTSMKRLLAYSSIAHAGYILIAIIVATQYSVAGGLYHLTTNAIMKGTAFIIIAALAAYAIGDRLADYKGLRLRNPLLALALTAMLLSLAGVPPFAGFTSKFVLFSAAVYESFQEGRSWLLWLAVAGVINSLISLFYYAKIIRYMYLEKGTSTEAIKPTFATNMAILIGLVLVVLLGVWPQLVLGPAMEAAASLLP
jgi:proton-translocating NADH-quinone oxidoreductase chain N